MNVLLQHWFLFISNQTTPNFTVSRPQIIRAPVSMNSYFKNLMYCYKHSLRSRVLFVMHHLPFPIPVLNQCYLYFSVAQTYDMYWRFITSIMPSTLTLLMAHHGRGVTLTPHPLLVPSSKIE